MSVTVYICGDSTASTYGEEYAPQAGWGQYFGDMFDESVAVENRAIGARSTKSFIAEGRLQRIEQELMAGDYLFIQFGHNDGARIRWRQTDAITSYRDNLLIYIYTARLRGATPVILTSICQRVFGENGAMGDSLGLYPEVARRVAAQFGVPLIDMYKKTHAYVASLGAEESKSLYMHIKGGVYPRRPDDLSDNTHTQRRGAEAFARLAANGVRELGLKGLVEHLKGCAPCM